MFQTLRLAAANGVIVGAHPGYNDQAGFGRRVIPLPPAEVGRIFAAQIGSLQALAAMAGTSVRYVKPHGALGNLAGDDRAVNHQPPGLTRLLDRPARQAGMGGILAL